jgi:hypothetical protein
MLHSCSRTCCRMGSPLCRWVFCKVYMYSRFWNWGFHVPN